MTCLSLTGTAPSRVAVIANREALYDIFHSNVDIERELTMFVLIHLFQFHFADTAAVAHQLVAKLVDNPEVLLDWRQAWSWIGFESIMNDGCAVVIFHALLRGGLR